MDPTSIERKWQQRWLEQGVFSTSASPVDPTFYCLEMLPYPSGKLHMGHVRNYSIGDAQARFRRMRGASVMYTIGWDAFGMPAENAAIRHGENPATWTRSNIDAMRSQLQRLGCSYDWDREIATCDPDFYRWNQWFFLKMFERGLAYRARRPLNWCESCQTVLANEQVVNGNCWRCDNPVILREFDQWFFRITEYAQELLDALDDLPEWPDRVLAMQRNWIGRSEGVEFSFDVDANGEAGDGARIEVFTTRFDTVFGATYLALAAEHPLVGELVRHSPERESVEAFVATQLSRTLEERFAEGAEKLGAFTGRYAIHPFTGDRIPIWVANFVLMDVGTGAIMSVPAHDQRDFEFAKRFGLPIRPVIRPADGDAPTAEALEQAFPDDGVLFDSSDYDGLTSQQARQRLADDARQRDFGRPTVSFRIKDWGISRQRYWGTPIPMVHCDRCGTVPVPVESLPVILPLDVELTGEGGSPLSRLSSFVQTDCPECKGTARRETDTMDTFVDSSWYYFRYLDPHNDQLPFTKKAQRPWTPVSLYIGGIEHATLHLIYTRFWTKMMRDLGLIDVGEPVRRLFTQGMVIKDGAKMSKSKGNVVDPDLMIDRYGADTTRMFCLFAAPPEKDLEWSEKGVEGCHRFLNRVQRTFDRVRDRLPATGSPMPPSPAEGDGDALELRRKTHRTVRKVTEDLEVRMRLNTALAAIMELINTAAPLTERDDSDSADAATLWALRECFEALARLISPFAPHAAEELWEQLGGAGFVSRASWPEADPELLVDDQITLVVQVGGKLRGRITLPRGATEEQALAAARAEAKVASHLAGRTLRRVIYVPDKLLNLVAT